MVTFKARAFRRTWIVLMGVIASVALTACGVVASTPPPPVPSDATVSSWLPQPSEQIAKVARVIWPNGDADLLVVAHEPPSGTTENVRVYVFRSTPDSRPWEGVWRSPAISGWHDKIVPLLGSSILKQTGGNGVFAFTVLQDVLASYLTDGAEVIRMSEAQRFRVLYSRSSMIDANLEVKGQNVLISDAACSDGTTTVKVTANTVADTHITCSMESSSNTGKVKLSFEASITGGQLSVVAADPTPAVQVGTTVAFVPADSATASLLNSGRLGLYSDAWNGPPLEEDMADAVSGPWQYQFRLVGTYHFVVGCGCNSSSQSPTWTVTVEP